MRFGVGELRLASLPASSPLLVAGDLAAGSGREAPMWEVETETGTASTGPDRDRTSGSGTFDFNSEDNAERWDLQFSPEIPIELEVQAGASQIELDLTKLRVPALASGARCGAATPPAPGSRAYGGDGRGWRGRHYHRNPGGNAGSHPYPGAAWRRSRLIRRLSRALTIPMSTSRRAMTHRPITGLTWRSGPAWPKSRYARCRSLGRPGKPRAAADPGASPPGPLLTRADTG